MNSIAWIFLTSFAGTGGRLLAILKGGGLAEAAGVGVVLLHARILEEAPAPTVAKVDGRLGTVLADAGGRISSDNRERGSAPGVGSGEEVVQSSKRGQDAHWARCQPQHKRATMFTHTMRYPHGARAGGYNKEGRGWLVVGTSSRSVVSAGSNVNPKHGCALSTRTHTEGMGMS